MGDDQTHKGLMIPSSLDRHPRSLRLGTEGFGQRLHAGHEGHVTEDIEVSRPSFDQGMGHETGGAGQRERLSLGEAEKEFGYAPLESRDGHVSCQRTSASSHARRTDAGTAMSFQ